MSWIWRFLKSTPLVFHVFTVAVMVKLVAIMVVAIMGPTVTDFTKGRLLTVLCDTVVDPGMGILSGRSRGWSWLCEAVCLRGDSWHLNPQLLDPLVWKWTKSLELRVAFAPLIPTRGSVPGPHRNRLALWTLVIERSRIWLPAGALPGSLGQLSLPSPLGR